MLEGTEKLLRFNMLDFINKKYSTNFDKLRNRFNKNKPFKYLILDDFFKKEFILEFKTELLKEEFYFKDSDLFSFYQTNDLINCKGKVIKEFYGFFNSNYFKEFIFNLTGIKAFGNIDCAGFIYKNTNYLLPHDDRLENRKIAYVLYLNDLDKSGELQFFNGNKITKSIKPKFNRLVLFEVKIGKTIHQVNEVKNAERLSIAGWFNDK